MSSVKPTVACPKDKIVNPATGRCVKASGKIGLAILANGAQVNSVKAKPDKTKSVDDFLKVLATCIKNNEDVKLECVVPWANIVKFHAFKDIGYGSGIIKELYDSKYTHEFHFRLFKMVIDGLHVWTMGTWHSYIYAGGSGGGGLVFVNDVIKKPDAKQRSLFALIYDTLRTSIKILNTSEAPLSVYDVIGQSVPKPTVYNGLEGIGFIVGNTNETQRIKARTHLVNGKLADLIDAGKYTSKELVKAAKRENWKKGDIIGIESRMGYRNQGKFFWNGNSIIDMKTDIDDYGSVPNAFPITGKADGFDAHTWFNVVDHNAIVPVNFGAKIGREINGYSEKKEYDYFVFTAHNVNWAVAGHGQLVNGKGFLSAAYETAVVDVIVAKYHIPMRQILMF